MLLSTSQDVEDEIQCLLDEIELGRCREIAEQWETAAALSVSVLEAALLDYDPEVREAIETAKSTVEKADAEILALRRKFTDLQLEEQKQGNDEDEGSVAARAGEDGKDSEDGDVEMATEDGEGDRMGDEDGGGKTSISGSEN